MHAIIVKEYYAYTIAVVVESPKKIGVNVWTCTGCNIAILPVDIIVIRTQQNIHRSTSVHSHTHFTSSHRSIYRRVTDHIKLHTKFYGDIP